ncbi:protease inhibitor I42 family protein [Klebsiella michiganensis]|uniref:protease inhibitor I42 family protein n=1 Tax=Klebsiella TaxID=570 RepID=UPI000DE70C3F|nr:MULTISPECIES: protease inhibitor I42 family protein [Klebsiella]MEB6370931.1 protease inhibitor I42 family protein [Klebsiella michiganensis]UXO79613.1 protease inhibitor I42 family protein [Klebsiella michiganensis]SSG25505.1 proteinase inhibitor I42, chagasin [Klebsiella pneumoniae]HBZ7326268.1 protease inhibitor I42 family protein [Klebsiella pneumoniae]HBZ7351973.1 protease inhibitor I42 family protein [Klebsiella pneumoniae]
MTITKNILTGLLMIASTSVLASNKAPHLEGKSGNEIHFSVESKLTTGYSWMIKSMPDSLIFVSSDYKQSEDCKDGAVGCSGKQTFTFIAQKTGKGELTLINGQPFDKTTWKEKVMTVNIK